MYKASTSPIVLLMSRVISPYIMLFGLYVVFHGHYSPGGGFQGGALMAASILLVRIANDERTHQLQFRRGYSIPMACVGVLIYLGIGALPMFLGGTFLDYGSLRIPGMDPADVRSFGILGVEVGVCLTVMAVLVGMYDNLMEADYG
jgi:multicomponent Na+:H+ antiporter subunit B